MKSFDSDSLTAAEIATDYPSLSLDYTIEIVLIITYVGVVFPFVGPLSLDRCNFYFLMILKKTLTFLSLSNPVLRYKFPAQSSKVKGQRLCCS